jgi:hypothetical protein
MTKMFVKDNVLKFLAVSLFVIGGTLLALNISISQYAFFGFVIAHSFLSYIFYKKDNVLFAQNFYFVFINVYAIYVRFF